MRPRRLPLALLLLCALAAPARAQTFYDVEIIVFEQLDTRASEQERWRPRVVLPELEGATAFERGGLRADELRSLPQGFQALPAERSRLQDELARLEESERYRVLRHLLWRQPALEDEEAVALRVRAGEPRTIRVPAAESTAEPADGAGMDDGAGRGYGATDAAARESGRGEAGDGAPDGPASSGATVTALDDSSVRPAGPFGGGTLVPRTREVQAYPLDGTVRLVVSRYLHVHTDLHFTTPVEWLDEAAASAVTMPGAGAPDTPGDARAGVAGAATAPRIARDADGQAVLSYPFVQRRRMRSNELHYLDHPVLGMLVWVTPRGDGDELPELEPGAS